MANVGTVEIRFGKRMKLFLTPNASQVDINNGVGQVIGGNVPYLPEFGIEFVDHPDDADIRAAHIFGDMLPELDVLMLHGLLWSGDKTGGPYNQSHHAANRRIVEGIRKARAITIPSEWAAMPFKRDMRLSPTVIPNGVDLSLWEGQHPNGHYVLWNKNRADPICDPRPALL
jgi:hypothetical protein